MLGLKYNLRQAGELFRAQLGRFDHYGKVILDRAYCDVPYRDVSPLRGYCVVGVDLNICGMIAACYRGSSISKHVASRTEVDLALIESVYSHLSIVAEA